MPRGQSSSSGAMIVVIVAVLLLGVPLLLCGGCLVLGFAVAPTPVGPVQNFQSIESELSGTSIDDSLQPVIEPDAPIDNTTTTSDDGSTTEPE